jgi:hypothetical protein
MGVTFGRKIFGSMSYGRVLLPGDPLEGLVEGVGVEVVAVGVGDDALGDELLVPLAGVVLLGGEQGFAVAGVGAGFEAGDDVVAVGAVDGGELGGVLLSGEFPCGGGGGGAGERAGGFVAGPSFELGDSDTGSGGERLVPWAGWRPADTETASS